MENLFPLPQGGAQKRPGTKYVAESKNNTKIRLFPFEYSTDQSYIIEFGNQYARFFTSNAAITSTGGSEDLSALNNRVSHWKLNEAGASTAVDDAEENHDGVATVITRTLHASGKTGTGCFNVDGQYAVEIADHANLSFIEGTNGTFSIAAWIYLTGSGINKPVLAKHDTAKREYLFFIDTSDKLRVVLYDESANKTATRIADDALTIGSWYFVAMTYDGEDGSWSGATAANFITLYVDGAVVASTATNDAAYAGMENLSSKASIGAYYTSGALSNYFANRIDNVALFSEFYRLQKSLHYILLPKHTKLIHLI